MTRQGKEAHGAAAIRMLYELEAPQCQKPLISSPHAVTGIAVIAEIRRPSIDDIFPGVS